MFAMTALLEQVPMGGVAILVRNEILSCSIVLRTPLQAVAVQLLSRFEITMCSLYLLNKRWDLAALLQRVLQLPLLIILQGDFKARSL